VFAAGLALLLGAVLLGSGAPSASAAGKLTPLGAYGYSANAINESGDIVGDTTANGFQQAYILKSNGEAPPTEKFLETLPGRSACGCDGPYTTAWDINASDVVAGESSNELPGRYFGGHEAVTWAPFAGKSPTTAPVDRGAFSFEASRCNFSLTYGIAEACSASANAINDAGELAGEGEYENEKGYSQFPYILPAGVEKIAVGTADMLTFNEERFATFEARGLNASGQTVVWPNPGEPSNENSSAVYPGDHPVPFASNIHQGAYHPINNSGWVVGFDESTQRAKVMEGLGGTVVELPPLAGGTRSEAGAINNLGDIVGSSTAASGCPSAVLWRHGEYSKPIDLNSQLPGGSSWHLWGADAINSKGQVLGQGLASGSCESAVLEPYELTVETGLSVEGAIVNEPTSGTATANFAVTLNPAQTTPVKVSYETKDGAGAAGATAPTDYTAVKGELEFKAGETAKTVPVSINAAGFKGKRRFSLVLSKPSGAPIETAEASTTIVGPSPLQVTIEVSPSPIDIQQTAEGPVVQKATAKVNVKNISGGPIESVSLPAKLTIGWHGAAPINALPIKQLSGPAGKELELGTIEAGASKSLEYTVQVEGDGSFDIQALAVGSESGQTINGLGTKTIEPTSQLLVFKAALGAKVNSQAHPGWVQAGTHFLINVHLEDRSYIHKLQVDPIEPLLSGNAKGGEVVPAGASTAYKPTGSESEVVDSPVVVLKPRESRDLIVVVGTSASDPFATQGGGGGGTRATIKFEPPELSTLNSEDVPTTTAEDRVVLTPGSAEMPPIPVDDSAPEPPPFTLGEATWAVGKGLVYGLWGATYGTVRGIFDLAALGVKGVIYVGAGTLNGLDHMVELWTATENDPAARKALMEAITAKVEAAYTEAPWLLPKGLGALYHAVDGAVGAYFTKISNAWHAGDWREALTDVADTGTNVAALAFGPAALKLASGGLTRLAPVADAWAAQLASRFTKVDEALQAASKAIEPALTAVKSLAEVTPGFEFKIPQLQKFFGVSAREADWLAGFAKAKKISIVFRSRAEESLAWLKKGAMLKPYWVKAKNVSWLDVQYLGYKAEDVGRVVMREPPSIASLESELEVAGVRKGSTEYQEVLERWEERSKDYHKELKEMESWNRQEHIKGKWPWQDNGVDPFVQRDEHFAYRFRLSKDAHDPRSLVPEIFNPATKKWGSITGDIDLIAITKADGSALSDLEHVEILKDLRNSPFGSQHPESATWTKGNEFWFPKKRSYLVDEDLVQAGPDGVFRSVKFNEALSKPEEWTKLAYRIFWDGGYKVGPGQVP